MGALDLSGSESWLGEQGPRHRDLVWEDSRRCVTLGETLHLSEPHVV